MEDTCRKNTSLEILVDDKQQLAACFNFFGMTPTKECNL